MNKEAMAMIIMILVLVQTRHEINNSSGLRWATDMLHYDAWRIIDRFLRGTTDENRAISVSEETIDRGYDCFTELYEFVTTC